jgi:thymidylate kinase
MSRNHIAVPVVAAPVVAAPVVAAPVVAAPVVAAPVGRAPAEVDARPLTRTTLAALDDAGVAWCLLRGVTGGEDVDVLIAQADAHLAVAVMREQGLLRLPAYGRGTHMFFLGLDPATCSWVEFDLVTDLTFGRHFEVRTATGAACLARRRRENGVWLPAPADEFWALLLHCLLDKGALAQRHVRRLGDLAGSASLDSPLVRSAPELGFAALLGDAKAGRWASLAERGPAVLRAWWRAHPLDVCRAYAGSATLRLVERVLQAWRRRGSSVALLGPDGAGKSTLASGLEAWSYFPARRVYMGLWPSVERPRGPLTAVLRVARRPFTVWRRYLAALRHRALGRLVIFDRYVYDALLPPRPPYVRLKRWYFRMLSVLCPPPHLVVLLDAPGTVLHLRSGEADPGALEADREQYARLAQRIPHLVRVDANRPPDAVRRDVAEHVWRHLRARDTR